MLLVDHAKPLVLATLAFKDLSSDTVPTESSLKLFSSMFSQLKREGSVILMQIAEECVSESFLLGAP